MLKEGVHINAIYKHYKGEEYYKVINVAFHHETVEPVVIYYRCDINGIYQSLRVIRNTDQEFIIAQPFYRNLYEFLEIIPGLDSKVGALVSVERDKSVPRFTLIKQL